MPSPSPSRDVSLVALAAAIVGVVVVCATILAIRFDTSEAGTAAFAVFTSAVGLAGVALGRLGGPPPQDSP